MSPRSVENCGRGGGEERAKRGGERERVKGYKVKATAGQLEKRGN